MGCCPPWCCASACRKATKSPCARSARAVPCGATTCPWAMPKPTFLRAHGCMNACWTCLPRQPCRPSCRWRRKPRPPSRRFQAIPLRATSIPTAAWARATCSPSPPRCNAWQGCWRWRCGALSKNFCPSILTSMAWWPWSTPTAAVSPLTHRGPRFPFVPCATSASTPTLAGK